MWEQVDVEERWRKERREINKECAGGALFGSSKGGRGAFPFVVILLLANRERGHGINLKEARTRD